MLHPRGARLHRQKFSSTEVPAGYADQTAEEGKEHFSTWQETGQKTARGHRSAYIRGHREGHQVNGNRSIGRHEKVGAKSVLW